MLHTLKQLLHVSLVCLLLVSCTKEYSFENVDPSGSGGTSSGTAVYTLEGAPGACLGHVISGTNTAGTALNSANNITLAVKVSTIGTYALSTQTINGMTFSGAGTFTTTGVQTIILTGAGTPTIAGTHTFNPGVNGCGFSITSNALPGPKAVFTLDGSPTACIAPVVGGTYLTGTTLVSSNTVQLAVSVTTAGNYNITSAVVNGFKFSGSGTLATGNQTITLSGSGTPLTAGPAVFTPVTGGCTFTINTTSAGGSSVYTLSGAPSACTTPVIAGTYTTGVPLTAANTVTITANVTTAGTYNISINAINGISFSGSGTLAVGTAQPIVLTGTGTPAAANTSSFTPATNGCSFSIITIAPPPATYKATGAPGACTPITVNGTYFTGSALNATVNTVTMEVNVTTPGSYTITSNTVNGMVFSKTGVFAGTGIQSVVLGGSGTPAAVGTNTFTAGTGGCTFTVTVTAPVSPCSGLVDGTFVLAGQFTLTGFSFGVGFNGQYQVTIQDPPVQIDVFFPGTVPPAPGTYSIGSVTMHCLSATFRDWNATSGSVYVSLAANGDHVVEFCGVKFSGVPLLGGATITSTGSGKMVF